MKIGVFDSGLGGLFVLRSVIKKLPKYDYIYLGDTKRLPYGNRSQKTIYEFTKEAVEYLFKKDCQLVVLVCNSASAQALRKIQKEYLPKHYPERRVLGVIVPAVESVLQDKKLKRVGILATTSTVNSGVYIKEIKKINSRVKVFQQAAPLLVPLIENGGLEWVEPILKHYLAPLLIKKVNAVVLGCTHYPILKSKIRKMAGKGVKIISQDEIIPRKLADYLKRHPEIDKKLAKNKRREFLVTDITDNFQKTAKKWFGKDVKLKLVDL